MKAMNTNIVPIAVAVVSPRHSSVIDGPDSC